MPVYVRGLIMKVYGLWIKEFTVFSLWSMHKTMAGAEKEMKIHKEDAYIMTYTLYD